MSNDEKVAAVGLIVENSMKHEAFFITMICARKSSIVLPFGAGKFLVPNIASSRRHALVDRSLDKSIRPLISELMHFAGGLPGGVPVKECLPDTDSGRGISSSVAIQKKVLTGQWAESIEAAKGFAYALANSLSLVKSIDVDSGHLSVEPGAFESPALVQFAQIVEGKVQAFRRAQEQERIACVDAKSRSSLSW